MPPLLNEKEATILKALLEAEECGAELYSLEIRQTTNLGMGTVYVLLYHLEESEPPLIKCHKTEARYANRENRSRYYYSLTEWGREAILNYQAPLSKKSRFLRWLRKLLQTK